MTQTPRDRRLQTLYSMSEAEWDELALFQQRLCPVCRLPRVLVTDHDHKDGHIRGLLCRRCNAQLREWITVEWLVAAAEYLVDPPADHYFGVPRHGRPGRVTNKRRRKGGRRKRVRRKP